MTTSSSQLAVYVPTFIPREELAVATFPKAGDRLILSIWLYNVTKLIVMFNISFIWINFY